MGHDCCSHRNPVWKNQKQNQAQSRLLWIILAINTGMLVIEVGGGIYSGSKTLLADGAHLLSHLFVIAISLYAVSRGPLWRLRAALLKGLLMVGIGISLLFEVFVDGTIEHAHLETSTLGWVALAATLGNLLSLFVLQRHKNDDLNMQSTWLCSRNDLLTNVAMLLTWALAVWSQSKLPDLIVGGGIALLTLYSSFRLTQNAIVHLRDASSTPL